MKIMKILWLSLFGLMLSMLITSCTVPVATVQQNSSINSDASFEAKFQKEKDAVYSPWNNPEVLPLTIVATAYTDIEVLKLKEYSAFKELAKQIALNPKLLDQISNANLSSKYNAISYIDYDNDINKQKYQDKFGAAFNFQSDEKETLNDVLREYNNNDKAKEKLGAEISIAIDYEEYQKGNLTIRGYKSIKDSKNPRNSYFYTLRKENYKNLNEKEKKEAIVNALSTILQLSIPNYVSFDKKALLKDTPYIRVAVSNNDENGTYRGEVWKYGAKKDDGFSDKLKGLEKELADVEKNITQFIGTFPWFSHKATKMAISSNLKILASKDEERSTPIKLLDIVNKKEIATLSGHTDYVIHFIFSPDGTILASGSQDKTIKLWDVASKKEIATLSGHTHLITSVAFSPNGKTLASGSWDKTIKLWDIATKKEIATLSGHSDYVRAVSFSPDGKTLASGSDNGSIKLWDIATKKEIATLSGHSDYVSAVSFSPDGKILVSGGSWDKTIKLWDMVTKKNIAQVSYSKRVDQVVFSKNGETLIVGFGNIIKLIDMESKKEIAEITGRRDTTISLLSISSDGKILTAGDSDSIIRQWDITGAKKLRQIKKSIEDAKEDITKYSGSTKQLHLASYFTKSDIKTLCNNKYILSNKYEELHHKEIKTIANILGHTIGYELISFFDKTNPSGIYAYKKDGADFLSMRSQYNFKDFYFMSEFDLNNLGYGKIYSDASMDIGNMAVKEQIPYKDKIEGDISFDNKIRASIIDKHKITIKLTNLLDGVELVRFSPRTGYWNEGVSKMYFSLDNKYFSIYVDADEWFRKSYKKEEAYYHTWNIPFEIFKGIK
jgi:WD40 repeat protein